MNMHPMDEPGETMIDVADQKVAAARQISVEQLRHLGTRQMAYLKCGMRNGELLFVVYGADGTPLVMVDAVETAVELAAQRGLGFVAVH